MQDAVSNAVTAFMKAATNAVRPFTSFFHKRFTILNFTMNDFISFPQLKRQTKKKYDGHCRMCERHNASVMRYDANATRFCKRNLTLRSSWKLRRVNLSDGGRR